MNPSPLLLAIFDVGGPEVLMIMFITLLLFGGQKLPELARGLGKSVREFKKATAGVEEEIKRAMETSVEPTQPKPITTSTTPPPVPAPSATQKNPFLAPPSPPPDKPAGT